MTMNGQKWMGSAIHYYNNLEVRRPDLLMGAVHFNFKEFEEYLINSISRLKDKNREFTWEWAGMIPLGLEEDIPEGTELFLDQDLKIPFNHTSDENGIKVKEKPPTPSLYFKGEDGTDQVSWFTRNAPVKIRVLIPEGEDIEKEQKILDDVFEAKAIYDTEYTNKDTSIKVLRGDNERRILRIERPPTSDLLRIVHNTHPLEMQAKTLASLRKAPYPEHLPLLRLVQEHRYAEWGDMEPVHIPRYQVLSNQINKKATDVQRAFVRKAMATPDFAILEGPPGSGKTQTIVEIIIQLIKRGKRILLVGSTHVAVDNVLERLIKEKLEKHDIIPIRIADRYDRRVSSDVMDYQIDNFVVTEKERILEKLSSIKRKSEAQQHLYSTLSGNDWQGPLTKMALDSANLVCGTSIGILKCPIIKDARSIEPVFDYLILDEASKTTFQEFLVPAVYCKRWILSGDVKQLSPYVEQENIKSNVSVLMEEADKRVAGNVFAVSKGEIPGILIPYEEEGLRQRYITQIEKVNEIGEKAYIEHSDLAPLTGTNRLEMEGANIVFANINMIDENSRFIPAHLHVPDDLEDPKPKLRSNAAELAYRRWELKSWEDQVTWRLSRLHEVKDIQVRYEGLERDIKRLLPYFNVKRDSSNESDEYISSVEDCIHEVRRVALPSILELIQRGFEKKQLDRPLFKCSSFDPHPVRVRELFQSNNIDVGYLDIDEGDPIIVKAGPRRFRVEENTDGTYCVYNHRPRALHEGLPPDIFNARHTKMLYQFRMHRDISTFPRDNIYGGEALLDARTDDEFRHWTYDKYGGNRRVFVDVRPKGYGGKQSKGFNANKAEVDELLLHLDEFIKWARVNPKPSSDGNSKKEWEVAILTFYRGQEKAIVEEMQARFKSDSYFRFKPKKMNVNIVVCTVDRFQGHEADVVLLSFVKGMKRQKGGRDKRSIGFLDNPNRLNVAITRPRYLLLIFWDTKNFDEGHELLEALVNETPDEKSWRGKK